LRTWRFTKLIANKTALGNMRFREKISMLNKLIADEYIQNSLALVAEKNTVDRLFLLLLRKGYYFSFILYSKLLAFSKQLVRIIKL